MKKFEVYLAIFVTILTVSAFSILNNQNLSKPPKTKITAPEVENLTQKNLQKGDDAIFDTDEIENTPANINITKTKKYILKYQDGKVLLISQYENGEENITPVSEINAEYLTETDLENLKNGIELSTEEELYKILEDYSS